MDKNCGELPVIDLYTILNFKTKPPVDPWFRPILAGFYCSKKWQPPRTGQNLWSTSSWVLKSPLTFMVKNNPTFPIWTCSVSVHHLLAYPTHRYSVHQSQAWVYQEGNQLLPLIAAPRLECWKWWRLDHHTKSKQEKMYNVIIMELILHWLYTS